MIKIEIKKITTQTELEKAFQLRIEVFVHEQGVPLEDELDSFDCLNAACDHLLIYQGNEAVGTGRIRIVDGIGKLERIVVKKEARKDGIGKTIVTALEEIAKEKGLTKTKLHGQKHAENFYQKLGYTSASDIFLEDGIEHLIMIKEIA